MTDLGKDVGRWSGGRLAFDARRRRLTLYGEDGDVLTEVEVGEKQLRNWLQRLLLAAPHEAGREPQEHAIVLLLARLEAGERPGGDATGAGPGPGPAPVRRIC
jgi:hypothetical protein